MTDSSIEAPSAYRELPTLDSHQQILVALLSNYAPSFSLAERIKLLQNIEAYFGSVAWIVYVGIVEASAGEEAQRRFADLRNRESSSGNDE